MESEALAYRIDQELLAEVLVLGGGIAGICAAIQAARLGCRTILVEKEGVLGGNSSPNLGVHVSGAHSFHPFAGETGVVDQLEEEAARQHAKILTYAYHYNTARQWDSILGWMLREAGVTVLMRHYAMRPVVKGSRIDAVVVEDLATYKTRLIRVDGVVVEASGDGQVAFEAGAEYRMGRESRSEFGERSAPEVADNITLGSSVTALVRRASGPVKFVPPPGTGEFEPGYGFAMAQQTAGLRTLTIGDAPPADCLNSHSSWRYDHDFCFLWHSETGGQRHTIEDHHEIYEEAVRQTYAAWAHIKQVHAKEAENWELIWISPIAGKRETRRFVGDYLLTQNDVENATEFEDAVAYGGYAIDLHSPTGTNNRQVRITFHSIPSLYTIPFRSLYSRNVENLLLAGRLVSVTHQALGTVRLMRTLGAVGTAVGVGAYLCKKYGCTPREVGQRHVGELRQVLLKEDGSVPGLKNEDPDDLARGASVSASSESRHEVTDLTDWLSLEDRSRGVMLWNWGPRLEEVEVYVRNTSGAAVPVRLQVSAYHAETKWKDHALWRAYARSKAYGPAWEPRNRAEWGDDDRVEAFQPVCEASAVAPAGFEGWLKVRFNPARELMPKDPTNDDNRYALVMPPTPGLEWGCHRAYYDFARRCEAQPGDVEYTVEAESHLFRMSPAPGYGESANVVNGYNRRFATNPVNMWISKRGEPLPQWVELDLGEAKRFSRVQVVFDTLTRTFNEMPMNGGREASPMCVKAYDLEYWNGTEWRRLASEQDNYKRFRVHTFEPVTSQRLRLVVRAVEDPAYTARVYEIRVYA